MIYLSGAVRPEVEGIGFMLTPNMGNKVPAGRTWAADNGRVRLVDGKPVVDDSRYSDETYLAWLAARDPSLCLFVTAPDVVGDHAKTLALSTPMFSRIRALGYKVAFIAQNGWSGEIPWDDFDCLFIGGDDAFKLGPQVIEIVAEARKRGKWVHMGRVNSYARLRYARDIGCHSVDGTYLRFGPKVNAPKLAGWLGRLASEDFLDLYGVKP